MKSASWSIMPIGKLKFPSLVLGSTIPGGRPLRSLDEIRVLQLNQGSFEGKLVFPGNSCLTQVPSLSNLLRGIFPL